MQYLLLIYSAEQDQTGPPEMKPWQDFNTWIEAKGWMVGGDALQPTATATSVRNRDGKRLITDGPFAETKEQLGGYYLINCDNLDQALEAAARIPAADYGTVEVRPVLDLSKLMG
ncbi:MAG: hypothetical protein ACI9WU_004722 [Myxococcota bacterium]|jgi:hypothetical protein